MTIDSLNAGGHIVHKSFYWPPECWTEVILVKYNYRIQIHEKWHTTWPYSSLFAKITIGARDAGCHFLMTSNISKSPNFPTGLGANFWLSVLTDIQNRGVEDMLIVCVDGLKGFPEAINSIFPKSQVQLCVVHQIRNSWLHGLLG